MGKVAIVTGGSRGIGRAICLSLAQAGYQVVVNYFGNAAAASETVDLIHAGTASQAVAIQADVGSETDRKVLLEKTLERFQRIDFLVNNAGISSIGRKDILEADEASWDRVFSTNLKGPYFLSQAVANWMIAHASVVEKPGIINISSLSAVSASLNRGDYCIAKAGMTMMTQLFALRLAEHGIRVWDVRPGIIDTDMTAGARDKYLKKIEEGLIPIPRMGAADDVGSVVAWLATSPMTYSTGDVINVDGGYHLRKL
ncbi:MAG: 3-ketoacyl-ACP reductase [Zavarzinella sp.]